MSWTYHLSVPLANRRSPADAAHAVVIGGSMAGLSAARVLANHFERVTVVERDALGRSAQIRKGVTGVMLRPLDGPDGDPADTQLLAADS
jgi:glycine/D-amino acid oxidase-like deaminating enzyme